MTPYEIVGYVAFRLTVAELHTGAGPTAACYHFAAFFRALVFCVLFLAGAFFAGVRLGLASMVFGIGLPSLSPAAITR